MKAKKETKKTVKKTPPAIRVLWIEDDELQRMNASILIEMSGNTGDVAGTGNEALEYMKINTYDIVLTDIGMPGMSGWELAEQVRKKYDGKIKVVIISGWAAEVDSNMQKKYGVITIIGKPFTVDTIMTLFKETAAAL
jgi:CheY-like chemotaxis protein